MSNGFVMLLCGYSATWNPKRSRKDFSPLRQEASLILCIDLCRKPNAIFYLGINCLRINCNVSCDQLHNIFAQVYCAMCHFLTQMGHVCPIGSSADFELNANLISINTANRNLHLKIAATIGCSNEGFSRAYLCP